MKVKVMFVVLLVSILAGVAASFHGCGSATGNAVTFYGAGS